MPNELSYEVSLERSNQIRADLPQHPEKYTMLTGDRPTGRLHLGHYFGTLKSRVELQDMGVHTNVLIADYQVITDRATPSPTCATAHFTWPAAWTPTRR